MSEPIIKMRGITKVFGSVRANSDVDLEIRQGEIHVLLGENGAGKSTLMNILTGIYWPDAGEIFYQGRKVAINSPKDAVALGIGMVHQHFRLIPTLTTTENICLYTDKKGFWLHREEMEKKIAECSERFGLSVDPSAKVWQLSVGEQQRVEIIKLLYNGAEILILDEPTAVLTPQEAQDMFDTLRKMADSGKAVVVISHKMNEVMHNADRITALKNGKVEDTMLIAEATVERLMHAVIGDRTTMETGKKKLADGAETVFEMKHVCALNDKGLPALKDVSLSIRKGEIFGIAGVAGNGQRELAEVIAGLRKTTAGTVALEGDDVTRSSVRDHITKGISFIPEDRLQTGLVPELNLRENIILKHFRTERYSGHGFLKRPQMDRDAAAYVQAYGIKNGGLDLPVSLMSGGNQQKLLFAREVAGNPKLIVAAYPVRGLDVGAADEIREILLRESEKGTAVLFISEELEEIFGLCDRIGVLCSGELMGIRETERTDFYEIGRLMTGQKEEEQHA